MNQSKLCLLLLLLSILGTMADYCGNGVLEGDEACDDGNLLDTDGCFGNCTLNAASDSCSCSSYATIHVDRPSWMNEMPPALAAPAEIFSVDCASNAECCFTITRPYVQNAVWSIGGKSLVPGIDTVPTNLPPESTSFQDDNSTSWVVNNNSSLPQGGCFDRLSANAAPMADWEVSVEGCDVIQTYCFNPIDATLPFECKNTTITSENGLPGLKVECDLYLDLLRPKRSNGGQPEWPTKDFLKWGNRLHTTIVFDMGVIVTSDLDYITPYINTRVNQSGYLVGNVELEYAGNDYTAVAIAESRLDSWDGLYADGTDSSGVVQVDRNGDELGYQLSISGNNIVIVSNSIREVYRNTIYIRLTVENENGTLSNVTLKVEIKAWNIVVDKSENPIGLDITPVIKIIQRNSNTSVARDFASGVIPAYPVLSTEDIFVMEIPKTDNVNLVLKTLTSELYEADENGDILAGASPVVLIDENEAIQSDLWEFQWGDAAYIESNDLSQVYSFRMATEAGNFVIVQTMVFEVDYSGTSKKFTVQQVTKPSTLQTTTQLTLTIASTNNRNSETSNTVVDIAVAGGEGETVTISAGGNAAGAGQTTGFTVAGPTNGNAMLFAVAGGLVGLVTVLVVALVIVLVIRKRSAALHNQYTMDSAQEKQLQMDIQL